MIKTKETQKPMSEKEFARTMAKITGRSVVDSTEAVRDFLNTFNYVVRQEQPMSFVGYFKLYFRIIPERTMFSHLTNTEMVVPEHKRVLFKLSKTVYKEPIQKADVDENEVDQFI